MNIGRLPLLTSLFALTLASACNVPTEQAQLGTWQKTEASLAVTAPDGSETVAALRHFELEAGQTARVMILGRQAAPKLMVIGYDNAPMETGVTLRTTLPASTDPQAKGRYVLADITATSSGIYTVGGQILPGCPREALDIRVDRLETVATSFTDRNGASRPLPPPASALGGATGQERGQDMGQDVFVTLPFRSTGPATVCLAGGTAEARPSVIWSVWFDARAGQTIQAELKGSPELRLALTGASAGSPQANGVTEGASQVARLTIPSDGIYSAGLVIPSAALRAGPVAYDLSVKVAQ